MPYVEQFIRDQYDPAIKDIFDRLSSESLDNRAGILNYIISKLVWNMVHTRHSYTSINEFMGVLECAKLEAFRRLAANYEDEKIESNGDIDDFYPKQEN